MHYYQFNIADYKAHTGHLTPIEDICFRRLLDWQYFNESPIPIDIESLCNDIDLKDNQADINNILNEFFTLTNEGWVNKRAFKVIREYHKIKGNHWSKRLTKSQRCTIQANRRATKKNAYPSWLTEDHKLQISEIYSDAATKTHETGISHEVDHIVPLKGESVCGLHVPWNLQILPYYKNRIKSNSFGDK